MTPHQTKFARAARRCRGSAVCMSKALSGYGILPHRDVAGTGCVRMKRGPSGKKRCAEFGYDRHREAASYDYLRGGKKIGKGGRAYKKGIWKSIYKSERRKWPGGGTQGMGCKSFIAKKPRCKVRCATFGRSPRPAGARASAKAARAACLGGRARKRGRRR